MQHLLAAARCDAGAVRDDVYDYVVEQLGGPGAVPVVGCQHQRSSLPYCLDLIFTWLLDCPGEFSVAGCSLS
jgi:hypothetical protein